MVSKTDFVRGLVWAGELTDDEIEHAASGITEKRYSKGAHICHRGDNFDHWSGVVSGLVKVSAVSHAGKAITFAGIGAGGWFGEGSVIKGEARKYDVVALRDSTIALMNRATFMWLYENSVGFNHFLLHQLNERLGQFIASVEQDRLLDPKARVARNLSWLFNPVLYPGTAGTVEITQDELAQLAGVSRAVTNRSLAELQDEGLITVSHGVIGVSDLNKLVAYGEEGDDG